MSDPTPEEVRASIVPSSTQLNADDLISGPITVTITGVRRGTKEQPIVVEIDGHKPYLPCKSMRRVLIAQYSDDPKAWIGQRLTLYRDESVLWAGVRVGGIRISHMSGLDKPKTFLITVGRGKRTQVEIKPIAISVSDQAYIEDAKSEIARADSMEVLKTIGFVLKTSSKAVQDAVRPVYAKRQKELQDG